MRLQINTDANNAITNNTANTPAANNTPNVVAMIVQNRKKKDSEQNK